MINLQLGHTEPLWCGLALALLVLLSTLTLQLRSLTRGANRTRILSLALLRIGAIICAAIALCHPYREQVDSRGRIPVLVDISDSMDEPVAEQLLERLTRTAAEASLALEFVPFSRKTAASPRSSELHRVDFRTLKSEHAALDYGASNLESALTTARGRSGEVVSGSGVILLSDGQENEGNVRELLSTAAGLRVFPFTPRDQRENAGTFRISQLYAPLISAAKRSVEVRVSVLNTTEITRKALLRVQHDTKTILEREIEVGAGEEPLFTAQSDPSQEGIREITATLIPREGGFPQSQETVFLSGEPQEKLLLLSGSAEDERHLSRMLEELAYQTVNARADGGPSEGFSLINAGLTGVRVVMLNNIALSQLPSGSAEKIKEYVKKGGGLLMIGGPRSFGLGGYLGTAIEDALPVTMVPPQTTEKRLNVAVSLVLDKSGSMGSANKLEFAKEAAREVVRNLRNEDFINVIGFDSAPWIVVKMARVGEVRDQAIDRIGRLFPAQKTNLFPAIDEARRSLVRAPAGRKHMIILTDGKVPDSSPLYVEFVKEMRLSGITVSTVMLGAEVDIDMLRQMAEEGGGSFYQTADARLLPRIFMADVKTASGERTMKEEREFSVRTGPSGIISTTLKNFPPLRGYVETRPKQNSELELVAMSEDKAQPLLVTGSFGKGRSAAFTSDLNGRWSSFWIGWERVHQFASELVSSLISDAGGGSDKIEFDLKHTYADGRLALDLTVFSDAAATQVGGTLKTPDGREQQIAFSSVSRGRYLASLDRVIPGRYEFIGESAGRKMTPVAFLLSGELFGERRGEGYNLPLLSAVASLSGGKLNPQASDLTALTLARVTKSEQSHWWLLLSALLIVLEVLLREGALRGAKRLLPFKTQAVPEILKNIANRR